jgi:hypothetical protein
MLPCWAASSSSLTNDERFRPTWMVSMSRGLEPLDQPGDLGRSTRTVGSLDHDELAGELLDLHAGQAQTEETLRRDLRHEHRGVGRGADLDFLAMARIIWWR